MFGEEYPDTIMSMGNLAWVFHAQGKFDDAQKLFGETLAVAKRVRSSDHAFVIGMVSGLADTLMRQGKLAEACTLYEDTLAANQRQFGDQHPMTVLTMDAFAGALSDAPGANDQMRMRAVKMARKASELVPNNADYQNTLGCGLSDPRLEGRCRRTERICTAPLRC